MEREHIERLEKIRDYVVKCRRAAAQEAESKIEGGNVGIEAFAQLLELQRIIDNLDGAIVDEVEAAEGEDEEGTEDD
jgi:hypothetical protein